MILFSESWSWLSKTQTVQPIKGSMSYDLMFICFEDWQGKPPGVPLTGLFKAAIEWPLLENLLPALQIVETTIRGMQSMSQPSYNNCVFVQALK